MNPAELPKFFIRFEKDIGFQRFYGGLYDGMRLYHLRILDEKAPVVEEVEKRLRMAVSNSLEEETEGLKKSEAETLVRRKRVAWLNNVVSRTEPEKGEQSLRYNVRSERPN